MAGTNEPSATVRLRVRPGCSYGPASILPAGTEFDGTADELRAFGDKLEPVEQPLLLAAEPVAQKPRARRK